MKDLDSVLWKTFRKSWMSKFSNFRETFWKLKYPGKARRSCPLLLQKSKTVSTCYFKLWNTVSFSFLIFSTIFKTVQLLKNSITTKHYQALPVMKFLPNPYICLGIYLSKQVDFLWERIKCIVYTLWVKKKSILLKIQLLSWPSSGTEFCIVWLWKMPASRWRSLWESSSFVPWLVLSAFRDVSGAVPEWPWISGFMKKSSSRASVPSMRFFVLLNSCDNFFVTLPSIFSEIWYM